MKKEVYTGFGNCPFCGEPLHWNSDWMASEAGKVDEDCDPEEDYLARSLSCGNCGATMDVYECPPDERKDYPYWNEDEDGK